MSIQIQAPLDRAIVCFFAEVSEQHPRTLIVNGLASYWIFREQNIVTLDIILKRVHLTIKGSRDFVAAARVASLVLQLACQETEKYPFTSELTTRDNKNRVC